jgi:uncharacterized protein (DUF885 family)
MSIDTFEEWLDGFFASYYERRPVNATFAGVHEYDDQLPDYSEEDVRAALEEIRHLQSVGEAFAPAELSESQQLDQQLAMGALDIQHWELEGNHFHRSNPCLYTGEAIFGVFSLFLTDYAPLSERVDAAVSRMHAIPSLLATARNHLHAVPTHWLWRARDEIQAARDFFGEDVERLMDAKGIEDDRFREAARVALTAFERFADHLDTVEQADDHGAGADALELVVAKGHFREESLHEIRKLGREELDRAQQALVDGLEQFDADTPEAALAELQERHPSVEEYYDRHAEIWTECRDVADGRFIDWPDYPLEFEPRPQWVRRAAQNLYFLFYRAPAPHDDIEPVTYLLEPVDPEMVEETQQERLRRWNTSQIKLNHVAHHGGLGHHVQNHRAYTRADSRIGEMAAVDTASRIALCCGGTMAEGWAPYATELLAETDFLTSLEEYSLHQTRRRMAARAVVDVDLHCGAMSADEAITFYRDEAEMSESGARYEVAKNSMFPGMALMYLLGTKTVFDLRTDLKDALGEAFDLQAFHEDLLSSGSVPVSLKAEQLREAYVE